MAARLPKPHQLKLFFSNKNTYAQVCLGMRKAWGSRLQLCGCAPGASAAQVGGAARTFSTQTEGRCAPCVHAAGVANKRQPCGCSGVYSREGAVRGEQERQASGSQVSPLAAHRGAGRGLCWVGLLGVRFAVTGALPRCCCWGWQFGPAPSPAVLRNEPPARPAARCGRIGEAVAQRAQQAGVGAVQWQRKRGQRYHGKVAALIEALKAQGVKLQ